MFHEKWEILVLRKFLWILRLLVLSIHNHKTQHIVAVNLLLQCRKNYGTCKCIYFQSSLLATIFFTNTCRNILLKSQNFVVYIFLSIFWFKLSVAYFKVYIPLLVYALGGRSYGRTKVFCPASFTLLEHLNTAFSTCNFNARWINKTFLKFS